MKLPSLFQKKSTETPGPDEGFDVSRRNFFKKAGKAAAVVALGGTTVLEQACSADDFFDPNKPGATPPTPTAPATPTESELALKALREAGITTLDGVTNAKLVTPAPGDTLIVEIAELPAGAKIGGALKGAIRHLDLRIGTLHSTAAIDLPDSGAHRVTAATLVVDAAGAPGHVTCAGKGEIRITGSIENGPGRNAPESSTAASMTFSTAEGLVQFATPDGQTAIPNRARNAGLAINASRLRCGFTEQSIGLDVVATEKMADGGHLMRIGSLPPDSRVAYRPGRDNAAAELNAIGARSRLEIEGTARSAVAIRVESAGLGDGVQARFKNASLTLGQTADNRQVLGNDAVLALDNSALTRPGTMQVNQNLGARVTLEVKAAKDIGTVQAPAKLTFAEGVSLGGKSKVALTNMDADFAGLGEGTQVTADATANGAPAKLNVRQSAANGTTFTLTHIDSAFTGLGDDVTLNVSGKAGAFVNTAVNGMRIGARSRITAEGGQVELNVNQVGANAVHQVKGYLVACKPEFGAQYDLDYTNTTASNTQRQLGLNKIGGGLGNDDRTKIRANVPVVITGELGAYATLQAGGPITARAMRNHVLMDSSGEGASIRAGTMGDDCRLSVNGSAASPPIGVDAPSARSTYLVNGAEIDAKDIPKSNARFPAQGACIG